MVNLEKLNYADLLIGFRQLKPMQQTAIAGLVVLVIYVPYAYFLLHMNLVQSVAMSFYSAIIFMVVFYFTTVLIMRKNRQLANQSLGPKKGLRNK